MCGTRFTCTREPWPRGERRRSRRTSFLHSHRPRLIAAYWNAERHREAVPAVDDDNRKRQCDNLRFVELRFHTLVDLVRHMRVRNARDRLGPFERGALAIAEERRLPPGVEGVDALLGFAREARLLRVHVEAIGAAVDLRRADLDELEQSPFDLPLHLARQFEHRTAHPG